jgi:hypothetical protein
MNLLKNRFRVPAVAFPGQRPAPRVEGVVNDEAGPQKRLVVADVGAEAEGDGEQPRRLGRAIEGIRVPRPNDPGEFLQSRSCNRYLFSNASKLQSGPSWVSSTPGTSKGTAPCSRVARRTSAVGTYRVWASGSMKRRISQGQAMRSILRRSRVTHFTGRLLMAADRTGMRQHHCRLYYWLIESST